MVRLETGTAAGGGGAASVSVPWSGFSTLPVEIYSSIRKGFTPEINAVSTLMIAVVIGTVARNFPFLSQSET